MAHENVIEMREITKIFGGVANDKINLELRKGEIHALLSEKAGEISPDEYVGWSFGTNERRNCGQWEV